MPLPGDVQKCANGHLVQKIIGKPGGFFEAARGNRPRVGCLSGAASGSRDIGGGSAARRGRTVGRRRKSCRWQRDGLESAVRTRGGMPTDR
jgi:hypothetical protein